MSPADHRRAIRPVLIIAERTGTRAYIDSASKSWTWGYGSGGDIRFAWTESVYVNGGRINCLDACSPRGASSIVQIINLGRVDPRLKAKWAAQWGQRDEWAASDAKETMWETMRPLVSEIVKEGSDRARGTTPVSVAV